MLQIVVSFIIKLFFFLWKVRESSILNYTFHYGNNNMIYSESLTKPLHFMIPEKQSLITKNNKYHFEVHQVCTFIWQFFKNMCIF